LGGGAGGQPHRNGNGRSAGNKLAACRLAGVAGNIICSVIGHVELLRPWCQRRCWITKFPRPQRGMRPMRLANALLLSKAGNGLALD